MESATRLSACRAAGLTPSEVTSRFNPLLSRSPRRCTCASLLILVVLLAAAFVPGALARTSPGRSLGHQSQTPVPVVPVGFVGVDVDGPLFAKNTPVNFAAQLDSMVANGVQSIRVAFNWATAQPYQAFDQVPASKQASYMDVGGRPTSFADTDAIVAAAAQRHLTVLPTILYTPRWDARRNPNGVDTPNRTAPYAEYAAALVARYGPHGIFWTENPSLPMIPITMWQIWNEPNIAYYWPQPFARSYVSLLRVTSSAIRSVDPGAKIVLGALTNYAWRSVGEIYRLGGGVSRLFDIVSINGFTKTPAGVMLYMHLMRNAMSHFNDGKKPLLATEVSWPSAVGQHAQQQFDFDTTTAVQAQNIAALLSLIGQQRVGLRLIGFYYYTWMGDENQPHELAFQFSGLLRFLHNRVTAKPALAAFRKGALALEHCAQKGTVATSCLRPG